MKGGCPRYVEDADSMGEDKPETSGAVVCSRVGIDTWRARAEGSRIGREYDRNVETKEGGQVSMLFSNSP